MKRILFSALLAVVMCFSLTGCRAAGELSNYRVLDGEAFESRLSDIGYTEITETNGEYSREYLCKDGDMEVSLTIYTNDGKAAYEFEEATSYLEDIIAVHSSMEINSRAKWSGATGDEKTVIYLIDNTIVAMNGTEEQLNTLTEALLQ